MLTGIKSENMNPEENTFFDWANDSQSLLFTNIENGFFFVSMKSKLFQYHENIYICSIKILSRIFLAPLLVQVNYIKNTDKYLLMKYTWNQQVVTRKIM